VEKGFQQPRLGGWWMDAELRRTKHDGVDVARPYLSFREAT
jgi:hypothetical protein